MRFPAITVASLMRAILQHNSTMNRLAAERSPYLLQHANNPVDWFPWGDEAFRKARSEEKPIFLSIGYSTCHWCHVMEHESFESDRIAAVLNEHFVSIKVDREERPDVDRVYMTFVQATTGSGGWPMSVWLTPDLKPFYGGTYFPPASRWGRPGFVDILQEIAKVWHDDREQVQRSADSLTAQLRGLERPRSRGRVPGPEALDRTVVQFRQAYDRRHGGFGDAPKFPRPSELLFLLREHARTGDADAKTIVLGTLRAMALGGLRDHVGGGFHRYSVDAAWRVPHFEKMLYDQAQLVLAYLEAAQASGDPFFADVAEDTLRYVMREMTDAGGGFYSAEDADSLPPEAAQDGHKAEGAFYLWRAAEIDALLGDDAPLVARYFGVEPGGNAPVDPQQEFTGKNLLYVASSIDELAGERGITPGEVTAALGRARLAMFRARLERPRPHLDDKVLTAWNGLMIAAFARASRVISARDGGDAKRADGREYLDAARRAATFVKARMWDAGSRTLLRRYRGGDAAIDGYADDYAYVIFGLVELFQADPDPAWLEWAIALQRRQDELFWDPAGGGWFSTTGRDSTVLLRMKEDYDGAEPSASAVAVLNLLTLAHLVHEPEWQQRIEQTFGWLGARLEQAGRGVPMAAAALSTYHAGLQQVVVVRGQGSPALECSVAARYLPFAVAMAIEAEQGRTLAGLMPFVAGMAPVDGRESAYVCRDFTCRLPATDIEGLAHELGRPLARPNM
jgi:uncharacterized protein YyaL (SSP411 family)